MNRRMRNRTSGGVGGRRGQPRLLPDLVADLFDCWRLYWPFNFREGKNTDRAKE